MKSKAFKLDDRVRVMKTPVMDSTWDEDTIRIFKLVVGHTFKVRGFNAVGFLELWARDDGSPGRHSGSRHTVWIEPECLKLVGRRK